jgi:hypothetical protein
VHLICCLALCFDEAYNVLLVFIAYYLDFLLPHSLTFTNKLCTEYILPTGYAILLSEVTVSGDSIDCIMLR